MLCVWVHRCDPGRVSDGSRLALYQTLSIDYRVPFFFYLLLACVYCVVVIPFLCRTCFNFCFAFSHSLELFVDSSMVVTFGQQYCTLKLAPV